MPNIKNIKQTMKKQGIPAEVISKPLNDKQPEAVIEFISQMDKLLSKEQCLAIMEEQGCFKGKISEPFCEFGKKYADKSIEEKIKLLDELKSAFRVPCHLNPDGSLSIYFEFGEKDKYTCICRTMKGVSNTVKVPLTYCGCCAGHVRYTHQFALGVKLTLKKVVSSPIHSGGKKRCEFLFEIAEG